MHSKPTLLPDAVHIWRIDIARQKKSLSKWRALLSKEEQLRADRYRLQSDHNTFIITRAALRMLLSNYLDAAPETIQLNTSANGKPHLATAAALYFNITHTLDLSLLAFSRAGALGIDVERSDRPIDANAIAARYFTKKEQSWLHALPRTQQQQAFLQCWVRKEAYIKALDLRLIPSIRRLDAIPLPSDAVLQIGAWQLQPLVLTAPYLGAICTPPYCVSHYHDYPID